MFHVKRWMLTCMLLLLPSIAKAEDPFSNATSNIASGVSGTAANSGALSTVNLSTGTLRSSYSFDLPSARGAVQPSLALLYDSSSGLGVAGYGWSLSMPSIVRSHPSGSRGRPTHLDPPAVGADRFKFNGSDLVPICFVGECRLDESFPDELNGWLYFRPEVDSDFSRFFWNPSHTTWVIQHKSGEITELGAPRDAPSEYAGIEFDEGGFYRWNIVRRHDAHGSLNAIRYEWIADSRGIRYLSDIYDTPNEQGLYAHRTHLTYAPQPNLRQNLSQHWQKVPSLALVDVLVTSATATSSNREFVRRYRLDYVQTGIDCVGTTNNGSQLLTRVSLEGRCSTPIDEASALRFTNCPILTPTTRFEYGSRLSTKAVKLTGPVPIEPAFFPLVLADINSDGFTDMVEPAPHQGYTYQTAYLTGRWNNMTRTRVDFAPSLLGARADTFLSRDDASRIYFGDFASNGRVTGIWRDGLSFAVYSAFSPANVNPSWWGAVKPGTLPSDLTTTTPDPKDKFVPTMGDIDGDGIVDMVGNHSANYLSVKNPDGSTTPFSVAVPHSWNVSLPGFGGSPPNNVCLLSDNVWHGGASSNASQQLADMNADGAADLLEIRQLFEFRCGDIDDGDGCGDHNICRRWDPRVYGIQTRVIPGKGDGTFDFNLAYLIFTEWRDSPNRLVSPYAPPVFTDVNGDGLTDMGVITNDGLITYLGEFDGYARTTLNVARVTPGSELTPWYAHDRCLLHSGDMNGRGLSDFVVMCHESAAYVAYDEPDPNHVADNRLTAVRSNGLTTRFEYASSAYSEGTKTIVQPMDVVSKITTTNGLPGVKGHTSETTYRYANPVYDGVARIFRGFEEVTARSAGIETKTRFLIQNCEDSPGFACPKSVDRPNNAMAGLPTTVDVSWGAYYQSTTHTAYDVRILYTGLDGRRIRNVYPFRQDTYLYDEYVPTNGNFSWVLLPEVRSGDPSIGPTFAHLKLADRNYSHLQSERTIDSFGNERETVDYGRPGIDDRIVTNADWVTIGSSWIWRKNEMRTSNRRLRFEYDHLGQLENVYSLLSGTVLLDRFHEDSSKSVAPSPADRSLGELTPVDVRLASVDYDIYGNIIFVAGTNARCHTKSYESDFNQLPQVDTSYVGGVTTMRGFSCGDTAISTFYQYDRGLEKLTFTQDGSRSYTVNRYDGFGRLTEVRSSLGGSTRIDHLVQNDSDPIAKVHVSAVRESWAYTDGFGNAVLTLSQADPSAGDRGHWIASGLPDHDSYGRVWKTYDPGFYSGDPANYQLSQSVSNSSTQTIYNPFGRVSANFAQDGTVVSQSKYHGLVFESLDERQSALNLPPTVTETDGHGRVTRTYRRMGGDAADTVIVDLTYQSTGELVQVDQHHSAGPEHVIRRMQYDSFGRMVKNIEPNTSHQWPSGLKGWVYAFNDSGDMVGTSDARGCGRNIAYDAGGRILSEDYSPCKNTHTEYTPEPEFHNVYDVSEEATVYPQNYVGRITATYDRASHSRFEYDAKGLITAISKQVAGPDGQYTKHWFRTETVYDGEGRPISATTGADIPELMSSGDSRVNTVYSRRGIATALTGSYGTIINGVIHDADGTLVSKTFGDVYGTTLSATVDARRRTRQVTVQRNGPLPVLADDLFTYRQGVLQSIQDLRRPELWPETAKPVERAMDYSPSGELTYVRYGYSTQNGIDKSKVSRNAIAKSTDLRANYQQFAYDWLGNLTSSTDDARAFWDRSFGSATHTGNRITHTGMLGMGAVDVTYDEAGNITTILVTRAPNQCSDRGICTVQFDYEWDEIGQLSRAQRFDDNSFAVDQKFVYAANGQRILKLAYDGNYFLWANVDVFPSLRLEHARFFTDYERTVKTEQVQLPGARVVYKKNGPGGTDTHVLINIGDYLGSSSVVVDKSTGELAQRTTYEAYGTTGSEYIPDNWSETRSPYGFGGKELDEDIGLIYYGARYYIPSLGHWASADPLTIHGLGADINPYAYVSGSPLGFSDNTGLSPCIGMSIVDSPCPPGTSRVPDGGGPGPDTYVPYGPPLPSNYGHQAANPAPTPKQEEDVDGPVEVVREINPALDDTFHRIYQSFSALRDELSQMKVSFSSEEYGKNLWNEGIERQAAAYLNLAVPGLGFAAPSLVSYLAEPFQYSTAPTYSDHTLNGSSIAAQGTFIAIEIAATAGVGAIASGSKAAFGGTASRGYAYVTEVIIPKTGSGDRLVHFQNANKIVLSMMEKSPAYAKHIRTLVPHFESDVVGAGGAVLKKSPELYTWHHVFDSPGAMQLVLRKDHGFGPLFKLFHPDGVGGFSQWGKSW